MTDKKPPLPVRLLKRLGGNLSFLLRYRLEAELGNLRNSLNKTERLVADMEAAAARHEEEMREALAAIRARKKALAEALESLKERDRILEEKQRSAERSHAEAEKKHRETEKRIAQLDHETLCLLRTSYGADPWLEKAKNLHKGERCFLLGCGPSLSKMDLSRLKNECVMGVNGTYLLDSVSLDYFCTVSNFFWKDHVEGLSSFRCQRMFLPPHVQMEPSCPVSWLRVVMESAYSRVGEKPWFFSKEADRYVCLGGTVIAVCLQVLYHLGFEEVITLGLDHEYGLSPEEQRMPGLVKPGGEMHAHFTEHYYQPDTQVYLNIPASERAYRLALQAFEDDGRRILNATPGTKLDIFPKVDYESLFT